MKTGEIGSVIQSRRKSRKISQAALSEIAGVGQRTLRAIENGTGNPELSTLLNICDVLGMNLKIEIIT